MDILYTKRGEIMKKFIFLFFTINLIILGAFADVSYVIKGGYAPLGFYSETVSGTESKTTLNNSITAFAELQARSKFWDNFYYGGGIGYIGSGTLGKELLGSDELGVDYFPIYLMFQYEPSSYHYSDLLMYFNFRYGFSYEMDKGRIKESAGFPSSYSAASPYGGISWGFEKNGFLAEAFYDFNVGASVNLTNISGETIIMNSRRIGINLGYRINNGNR